MLSIAAVCLVVTALLAYVNHRFIRLPNTIGLLVGTTSSHRAEAAIGTANHLASGLRPLHFEQRPFETVAVARPNGRLVPVSVSTPAGDQRRQPLRSRR
jgi:hypothetical protein